jgi:hypothetical protein
MSGKVCASPVLARERHAAISSGEKGIRDNLLFAEMDWP